MMLYLYIMGNLFIDNDQLQRFKCTEICKSKEKYTLNNA